MAHMTTSSAKKRLQREWAKRFRNMLKNFVVNPETQQLYSSQAEAGADLENCTTLDRYLFDVMRDADGDERESFDLMVSYINQVARSVDNKFDFVQNYLAAIGKPNSNVPTESEQDHLMIQFKSYWWANNDKAPMYVCAQLVNEVLDRHHNRIQKLQDSIAQLQQADHETVERFRQSIASQKACDPSEVSDDIIRKGMKETSVLLQQQLEEVQHKLQRGKEYLASWGVNTITDCWKPERTGRKAGLLDLTTRVDNNYAGTSEAGEAILAALALQEQEQRQEDDDNDSLAGLLG